MWTEPVTWGQVIVLSGIFVVSRLLNDILLSTNWGRRKLRWLSEIHVIVRWPFFKRKHTLDIRR